MPAYCKDDTPNVGWNDIPAEDKDAAMVHAYDVVVDFMHHLMNLFRFFGHAFSVPNFEQAVLGGTDADRSDPIFVGKRVTRFTDFTFFHDLRS